jgi:TolB-like protein/tetratricopeptide (TPR) repeat protein/predicted Ser/Thr protein kinase
MRPVSSPPEVGVIGRTISHYKILEKLGEGGMGVVYRAEDTTLERPVALKFLSHFTLGTSRERARLIREAKAAAALDHPNICTVYEVDEVDGETFIAMAFLDGGTLGDRIAEGPLTLDEAMDFATQIAEGLAAAHRKGVVHRDIKPGNVMITSEGRAKILDFGLATSQGCTQLTRTGATVGTVAYMSPEQTQGAGVDHRSDIWSFGVMLFEMLTGRRPFEGGHDQAVIHSILNDEPARVSDLRPDVPDGLDRIVAGALIKDREERYQSIEDVLEDLRSVGTVGTTSTVSLRAPRPVRARSVVRTIRQWRTQLAATAAIVVVGIAGVAIYTALIGDGPADTGSQRVERVVVAPFENRTGNPSLDHIGESASESICAGLAQVDRVQNVACPAEGTEGSSGSAARLLRSARDAGATILVTGSFDARSDTLSMEARLLDVTDGAVLSAIPDEAGPPGAPDAVAARIRSRVMGALGATTNPYVLRDERSYAPTWEAYQEYEAGLQPAFLSVAVSHFRRAAELDPAFMPAIRESLVAQLWILNGKGQFAGADSLIDRTLTRPGLLTPHGKLAFEVHAAVYRGDYSEALQKARQLVQVESEYPTARRLVARNALRLNRPQEAVNACRPFLNRAHEDDSHAEYWVYWFSLTAYHMLGEFEIQLEVAGEAKDAFPGDYLFQEYEVSALAGLGRAEEIDRVITDFAATPVGLEPEGAHPFYGSKVFALMVASVSELAAHGHTEEAAVRAESLVDRQKGRIALEGETDWAHWQLGWALHLAEYWEEALAVWEELEPPRPDLDMVHQCMIGCEAARLGDRERAVEIKQTLIEWDTRSKAGYNPGLNKYFAGSIAAVLGEREEAMELINMALAEGNDIWDYLHFDTEYAGMRDYPPFQRLLEPKG